MSLDAFIAGRYPITYSGVGVGITDRGTELQQESAWQVINTSDAYGDSIIDGVYRGGNLHLQFTCKAYKAGSITPFWPWGTLGVMQSPGSPVGRLASNVASPTVLSVLAGTPAAVAGAINTLTAPLSILSPNSPASLLFTSELRQVPIRLLALPSDNVGTTTWFSTT